MQGTMKSSVYSGNDGKVGSTYILETFRGRKKAANSAVALKNEFFRNGRGGCEFEGYSTMKKGCELEGDNYQRGERNNIVILQPSRFVV